MWLLPHAIKNAGKTLTRRTPTIGPSFIEDTHHYARFTTDKGMFEIIYGGTTEAMQPFGNRLKKDEILHVMAYVRSLKK